MTKTVWHVHAYHIQHGLQDPHEEVYSRYFTTREAAHEIYARGEKEIGTAYGIHWHLTMHALDADYSEDELDELIQETKAEEEE